MIGYLKPCMRFSLMTISVNFLVANDNAYILLTNGPQKELNPVHLCFPQTELQLFRDCMYHHVASKVAAQ